MNTKGCITCEFASHILFASRDRKEMMSFYCYKWQSMFSEDEPCESYQKASNND